jgi:hypothetical protein
MNYSFNRPKSTTAEYPATVQDKINACPVAGGGLHARLCTVANELRHSVDAHRGFEILRDLAIERGRPTRTAETEARELIKRWADDPATPVVRTDRAAVETKENVAEIRAIVARDTGGLAELRDQSPVRLDDSRETADDIVDLLFPDGDLICIGKQRRDGFIDTHSGYYQRDKRMADYAYIVPNPMGFPTCIGVEDDGTEFPAHPRRMENVRYRRWLVIDFDTAKFGRDGETETFWKPLIEEWESQEITPKDAQSRLIAHLSNFEFKLGMVVDTAGKSLHSWFAVSGAVNAALNRFMRNAISVGADTATWTVSQFVRMPHGTREDGNPQLVQYLNANVLNSNFKG